VLLSVGLPRRSDAPKPIARRPWRKTAVLQMAAVLPISFGRRFPWAAGWNRMFIRALSIYRRTPPI